MKKFLFFIVTLSSFLFFTSNNIFACTGITLKTAKGEPILARTIEWGGNELNSHYVIVPRGYEQQSYLIGMKKEGLKFKAKYGYVGLSVEMPDFVVDGQNEAGLSAGLFYFPGYGKYEDYKAENKNSTLSDLQFVSWLLSSFANVDEAVSHLKDIHITAVDPRASTVHWRIADKSGHQVVIEIINGKLEVYENPLGVLTNSPNFEWQITNLNNYVNLSSGTAPVKDFGAIKLSSFGAGSSLLGLPGDITPPSRFVRAAFYQCTAPTPNSALEAVLSAFHILNNFDIPIGAEFANGKIPEPIPSATQWTIANDLQNHKVYYRTMYNSNIRLIDLNKIDFSKIKYTACPLDDKKEEKIIEIF